MTATATNNRGAEMAKKKKSQSYESGSYRMQIRLPDDWRDAIETAAAEAGVTTSEFIRRAVRSKLPTEARKALGEVRVGRPCNEQEDE